MYHIAQVQEPYTAVSYLSERIPIVKILQLKHPDEAIDPVFEWSGWAICEAFAIDRGFLTTRAARPDVYRAANLLLRMANDGRLLLIFRPPGFFNNLEHFRKSVKSAPDPQRLKKKEVSPSSLETASLNEPIEDDCGFQVLASLSPSS